MNPFWFSDVAFPTARLAIDIVHQIWLEPITTYNSGFHSFFQTCDSLLLSPRFTVNILFV